MLSIPIIIFFFINFNIHISSSLPIFPSAEGFGSHTFGGSGRHLNPPSTINTTIYKIRNLHVDGIGSLKACCDGDGPRVCIFEISGMIDYNGYLYIKNPYITIAGGTAPKPGITLKRTVLRITTHDVFVQHVFIRSGEKTNIIADDLDALTIGKPPVYGYTENIIIDHCSFSYAVDETLSCWYRNENITFSNCFITSSLHDSFHPKGPHGKGLIIGPGSKRITVRNNYFAHNYDRNPLFGGTSSTTDDEDKHSVTEFELINNFIYNWRADWSCVTINYNSNSDTTKPQFGHLIGNYFLKGPDTSTSDSQANIRFPSNKPLPGSKFYIKDNYGVLRQSDSIDDWAITTGGNSGYRQDSYIFPPATTTILTQYEAKENVLKNSGARPEERGFADHEDYNCVNNAINGDGRIINCIDPDSGNSKCDLNAGGWANFEENYKEISVPDMYWIVEKNGYTRLENWLFGILILNDIEDIEDTCSHKCPHNSYCVIDECICIESGIVTSDSCPLSSNEIKVITSIAISGLIIILLVVTTIIICGMIFCYVKSNKRKNGTLINVVSSEEFTTGIVSEMEESDVNSSVTTK